MNIQNVFAALDEDQDNSALGIICAEFERQGYKVTINGISVSSDAIFEGEESKLENSQMEPAFALYKGGKKEQEFKVKFFEFHEIAIVKAN